MFFISAKQSESLKRETEIGVVQTVLLGQQPSGEGKETFCTPVVLNDESTRGCGGVKNWRRRRWRGVIYSFSRKCRFSFCIMVIIMHRRRLSRIDTAEGEIENIFHFRFFRERRRARACANRENSVAMDVTESFFIWPTQTIINNIFRQARRPTPVSPPPVNICPLPYRTPPSARPRTVDTVSQRS